MWRLVDFARQGRPVHTLWPADMQEEIALQINTKVPRCINEPTSAESIASMHEGGRTDWVLPDFLASHGRNPTEEGAYYGLTINAVGLPSDRVRHCAFTLSEAASYSLSIRSCCFR
jgi:hypothetical protein